jgi:hypothetical protein
MVIGQIPFIRRYHETQVAREFDTSILGFMSSHCASIGTSRFTPSFTIFLVRYPVVG